MVFSRGLKPFVAGESHLPVVSAETVDTMVYPRAPKSIGDRVVGTVYTTSGGKIGKWDGKRDFFCLCKGFTGCSGNVTVNRCKGASPSTSTNDAVVLSSSRPQSVASASMSTLTATSLLLPRNRTQPQPLQAAQASSSNSSSITDRERALMVLATGGAKVVIPMDRHFGTITVLGNGRWDKIMAETSDWVVSGSTDGIGFRFPLRIDAEWVVEKKGKHAAAVRAQMVRIKFTILLDDKGAPKFVATNFDSVFAVKFSAKNPTDLERKWLAQNQEGGADISCSELNGKRFTGFSSLNLAMHFGSLTDGFEVASPGHSRGGCSGREVCHRQKRRQMLGAMEGFEAMLCNLGGKLGGKSNEEVFDLMLESDHFKKYGAAVLEHEQFKDPTVDLIVKAHAASTNKAERRYLLSIVSANLGIEKCITLFRVTVYECKEANLQARLRTLPVTYHTRHEICKLSVETVNHMKSFVLNPENVLRAAHGKNGCFKLQRLMNRHRLYIKYLAECKESGIKPMSMAKFYEVFSEKYLFKDTSRKTCCCEHCINGGLAFDALRDLLPTICFDGEPERKLKAAITNVEKFLQWDYKSLLKVSSCEERLCMTHALSQHDEPDFRKLCDHVHVNTFGNIKVGKRPLRCVAKGNQLAHIFFGGDSTRRAMVTRSGCVGG